MPSLPTPDFNTNVDIYTGTVGGLLPGPLRQQGVRCQIFSAFGSSVRAVQFTSALIDVYTHVLLFPAGTDIRDDFNALPALVGTPIADWLGFPAGQSPILKVVFVESRLLGTPDVYLRVYAARLGVVGGPPPL